MKLPDEDHLEKIEQITNKNNDNSINDQDKTIQEQSNILSKLSVILLH